MPGACPTSRGSRPPCPLPLDAGSCHAEDRRASAAASAAKIAMTPAYQSMTRTSSRQTAEDTACAASIVRRDQPARAAACAHCANASPIALPTTTSASALRHELTHEPASRRAERACAPRAPACGSRSGRAASSATFTQAMRSSSPAPPSRTSRIGRTSPTITSDSGITLAPLIAIGIRILRFELPGNRLSSRRARPRHVAVLQRKCPIRRRGCDSSAAARSRRRDEAWSRSPTSPPGAN